MNAWAGFRWAFLRDVKLAFRRPADIALTLLFFIFCIGLFPLGLGYEPNLLTRIAPSVFWVAALLATVNAMPRLFDADQNDGTLDQILVSPAPLAALVAGKIAALWVTSGLMVSLISPLVALQYALPGSTIVVLFVALLIGTLALTLIGSVCAALALSARTGGTLLALITLPLFVPVLIFGAGSVEAVQSGISPEANLSLLGGLTLIALVLTLPATAAALRIAQD